MNIYEKLIEIRKEVPYLQKEKSGFNYKYVEGSIILAKIKDKMNELKLLLIPEVLSYNQEFRTYEKINKKTSQSETVINHSIYCTMNFVWVDSENPEQRLQVPFVCVGTQDDISKAFGSALTYSERYFLMKFFNIATDEDDPDKFQDKLDKDKLFEIFKEKYDNAKDVSEFKKIKEESIEKVKDKKILKEISDYAYKVFNERNGE